MGCFGLQCIKKPATFSAQLQTFERCFCILICGFTEDLMSHLQQRIAERNN